MRSPVTDDVKNVAKMFVLLLNKQMRLMRKMLIIEEGRRCYYEAGFLIILKTDLGTVLTKVQDADEAIEGLDVAEQWKKTKFQKLKRSPLVQDVGEIFHLGQDEIGYLLPILHNLTEPVNVFEI